MTIMSSMVTTVFKATIGLLVNTGRDKAAEKLKDGDVTDQKFRGLIVREIDDIKRKLDGLSRKDLLASMSFFKEGIEHLYEVFDNARSKREYGAVTTEAACVEAFSLTQGMRNLELTDLDESAMWALSNAKERFKESRRRATDAFNNEALETSDRILAMQYRVMATILETVDNPAGAVASCRVCIEELNSLPAVRNSFEVQLKKGLGAVKALFGKDERRNIISNVCHVNRVIYDVTQTVGKDFSFCISPTVDTGEGKVDPLRDGRVTKVLRTQGMEHCCVTPWSLGEVAVKEHEVSVKGIATNSSGHFIVGDGKDTNVKVFDSTGTFIKHFRLPIDYVDTELGVFDVATGKNDNIYVLVGLYRPGTDRYMPYGRAVYELLNNPADLHHKFLVRGTFYWGRLTVTDSNKILVLTITGIDVFTNDGQLVCSFGEKVDAWDITAANNGRVLIMGEQSCVHIFSEHGDHLNKFKLQGCYSYPSIAFHQASEHVVVASVERDSDQEKGILHVEIYTKDGEFVRSTHIHQEGIYRTRGMTVTTEGRIAVVCRYRVRVSQSILPPKLLVM